MCDGEHGELGCCLVAWVLVAAAMIDRECMRWYALNEQDRLVRELASVLAQSRLEAGSLEELARGIMGVARELVGRLCKGG